MTFKAINRHFSTLNTIWGKAETDGILPTGHGSPFAGTIQLERDANKARPRESRDGGRLFRNNMLRVIVIEHVFRIRMRRNLAVVEYYERLGGNSGALLDLIGRIEAPVPMVASSCNMPYAIN